MLCCSKCEELSDYDPAKTYGLCPACFISLPIQQRAILTGEWYTYCVGGCKKWTNDKEEWAKIFNYCPECWNKLTIRQRATLYKEPYWCCKGKGCTWVTTDGWKETYGYCPSCWLKLTPAERAILQGKEPPPLVETKVVTVRLPAEPSSYVRYVLACFIGGLTAVIGFVVLKFLFH